MKLKHLLDFDPFIDHIETALAYEELKADYDDARSLLDGAYEVVELFNPQTPSQVEWKQQWLEGARRHGASGL